MKNIQIQKVDNKYRVRMHYGDRDENASFDDMDQLLDFIGKFFREDSFEVSSVKDLKETVETMDIIIKDLEATITSLEMEK